MNALKSIFLTSFNIAKIRRSHLLLRDKGEKNKKIAEKKRTRAITLALENENDYLKNEIEKMEKELIEQKEGNTNINKYRESLAKLYQKGVIDSDKKFKINNN